MGNTVIMLGDGFQLRARVLQFQFIYRVEVLQVVGEFVYLLMVDRYVATTCTNTGQIAGGLLKGGVELVDATRSALYPLGELVGGQRGIRYMGYGSHFIAESTEAVAEVADQFRTDASIGQHFVERSRVACIGGRPDCGFWQFTLIFRGQFGLHPGPIVVFLFRL